jgi:hypothetical protein
MGHTLKLAVSAERGMVSNGGREEKDNVEREICNPSNPS